MITFYDYDNQAWVQGIRYAKCGHLAPSPGCYACKNHGRPVLAGVLTRAYDRGVLTFDEMSELANELAEMWRKHDQTAEDKRAKAVGL